MRTLSKSLLGVAGAAVAATSLATPAEAQRYRRYDDRYYGRDRGVDAGDVIAGIAIVGGVAALISALDGDRGYGRDRYYSRSGGARRAVDACARAARQEARYAGDRARVGEIYDVDRAGNGYYRVRGTLNVRDYGYDRRGYRRGYDNDRVGFTCTAGYGRVVDLNIGGGYDRYDRYDDYRRDDYRYDRYGRRY